MSDCLSQYPADVSCCSDWNDHTEYVQCRALVLAWDTMRLLSGGRVGHCRTTMRPCLSEDACDACWEGPRIWDGCWRNMACGGPRCSCTHLYEIIFPGAVAEVCAVSIDGKITNPNIWRLDNKQRLVRVDGGPWPSCQDMNADCDKPGSVCVEYIPGIRLDTAGSFAAGILACEFAKACDGVGGKCRLPSGVTSLVRQGVSMTFNEGLFANGQTGIREVDSYIRSINPYGLVIPPKVWSVDLEPAGHRYPA
jgi:hypothetical protein